MSTKSMVSFFSSRFRQNVWATPSGYVIRKRRDSGRWDVYEGTQNHRVAGNFRTLSEAALIDPYISIERGTR